MTTNWPAWSRLFETSRDDEVVRIRNVVPRTVERLEPRVLLAHFGIDFDFGDSGFAPAGGSVLVDDLPGGKILAVSSAAAARLNDDGSADAGLIGRRARVGERIGFAAVSGQRVILVGDVLREPTGGGQSPPRTLFARAFERETRRTPPPDRCS